METFYAIDDYPFDQELAEHLIVELTENEYLGRLWLISNGHEIIGYIALTFGFSFEYAGRDAFIDELFIKEGFRGMGFGAKTMEQLEIEARRLGVNAIHLEVERHNARGNRLYENQGYVGNDRKLLTKRIS